LEIFFLEDLRKYKFGIKLAEIGFEGVFHFGRSTHEIIQGIYQFGLKRLWFVVTNDSNKSFI
jgi:hypothetical protein